MSKMESTSLRSQIFSVNVAVISVTILLTMLGTLFLTLHQNRQARDHNLLNSARVMARVPLLISDLEDGEPSEEMWEFLDISIAQIGDIDTIAVADVSNTQFYYPDRAFIGQPYAGTVQQRILEGEEAFTSNDTGVSGAERCAYAPIRSADGTLLGFVMVGVYIHSASQSVWFTVVSYILMAAAAIWIGSLLSLQLSSRIKEALMGHEPEDFRGLFHQREDILEALEEGVLAIDQDGNVIYVNRACEKMLGVPEEKALGKNLHENYPRSTLDRVLKSKRAEHNVPLLFVQGEQIIADRMLIQEEGQVIGAVEILRNRTEVTRLAKDLTGVRHMVEAMRAYTHEFMNKLHVILGLLQLGNTEKAEAYIMEVTSIQQKAVGAIMRNIEEPSVAALLVGKTSRCAELGIKLNLREDSRLGPDERILPASPCVTILGNLIENSIDAINLGAPAVKEITVSIQEEEDSLFLSVEDTGPGMEAEVVRHIFQKGFSTKGDSAEHGTGLSLLKEIVTAYQGEIRVESEPGLGTTFFVTFHHRAKG